MTTDYREFDTAMPDDREYECDPVGTREVAQRIGVQERTVHMWGHRGRLPEPDWPSINGYRAWNWATILWWAGETGRLNDDLVAQYRATFGQTEPDLSPGRKVAGTRHRVDADPDLPSLPSMSPG